MTLAQWMAANGVSDDQAAAQLGIDRSSVSRLRRGKHAPSWRLLPLIVAMTNGAVTAESFFGLPNGSSQAKSAAAVNAALSAALSQDPEDPAPARPQLIGAAQSGLVPVLPQERRAVARISRDRRSALLPFSDADLA